MVQSTISPWIKFLVPLSAIGIGLLGLFDVLTIQEHFILLVGAMVFTLYLLRRQYAQLRNTVN